MTTGWHFQPLTPGPTLREPIAGAFFASDAVSDPGEALVREGIQNSLDATLPGCKTSVRISLIVGNENLDWQEAGPHFDGASGHYAADDNGLRKEDLPSENEARTALIFEDFGTCGLQGDPKTPYPPKERGENNFFHFFRAEGLSDKDPGKRGSWGLGKDTFFRVSRVNTVFGLTVRNDDGRHLLMGKTVLKSHWVGDNYCQDGYFGVRAENENMVMPIESPDAIDQFQQLFHLQRGNDPGLSIIVPWFDPEVTEQDLLRSVIKNYSYTILSGDLDVIVETAGIETWIEKDNLIAEAQQFSEQADMLPAIELAQWALSDESTDGRHTLAMTNPRRRWSWDKSLFENDLLKVLDGKLKGQERISIRVPVTVRKRDGTSAVSYFDLYMVNENSSQRLRPVFIRDGIVISDVRAPLLRGIRAFVVVNDAPLSEFLRQSENPSHTIWQAQQVKKDYTSGVADLRFVVESVRRICDLVAAEDKEEDRRLLADIFPVPGTGGRNGGSPPVQPPEFPPARPSRFSIRPAQGGFSVVPGVAPIPAGSHAEISVAYDVRRGSATGQYRTTDFQLNVPPIQYQCEGAVVIDASNNKMIVRVTEPDDFRLTVTGFDPNRQIYVDVKESGGS